MASLFWRKIRNINQQKTVKYLIPVLFFLLVEAILRIVAWYQSYSLSILNPALLGFGLNLIMVVCFFIYLLKTAPEVLQIKWTKRTSLSLFIALIIMFLKSYLFQKIGSSLAGSGVSAASLLNSSRFNPLAHYLIVGQIIFIGPVLEELLSRPILMTHYFSKSRLYLDVLLSATIFSAFHLISYPWHWPTFSYYFLTGCFYAGLFRINQSVWPSILMHVMWNGFIYIMLYIR